MKVSNLSDFAFAQTTREQLARLPAAACEGFRSTVFNQIDKASGLYGVSAECVSRTPVAVFANLANGFIQVLPCQGLT